jgi:hypothetical protein
LRTVFEVIDSSNFHIGGFYPANIFKNTETWALYFRLIVYIGTMFWLVFGFDGTINQLTPLFSNIVPILTLKADYVTIFTEMQSLYGKGSHFSAIVIYGISWLILYERLKSVGIIKSFNFFMVMMLTLLNMGIFEVAWNQSCAYFQNLPWLLKQPTNIIQYNFWIIFGVLAIAYLYTSGFKLNFNKYSLLLIVLSIGIWSFWIYYPFHIEQITVATTTGLWHSSPLFPQTLYTIDPDPTDNIYKGVFYYVENNWIHLTNILAKIIITYTIMDIVSPKRVIK